MRMKTIVMKNAKAEGNNESEHKSDANNRAPEFSEGLSRMRSGMCANMSKAVYSTIMAHLIVSNDGSWF